jgi:uncharacterized protein (TIGR03083 family)
MSTDADRTIDALQSGHDDLAGLVRTLTPVQLTGPSGASEWDVSQVLSHLGSGAVITKAGLDGALSGTGNPAPDFNQGVWARWNAMTPQERADGVLAADAELLAAYHRMDGQVRESLRTDLGFLPEPVDLATAAGFRLNEFALHSWDVRVAFDPAATIRPEAVPLLVDRVAFLLGWGREAGGPRRPERNAAGAAERPRAGVRAPARRGSRHRPGARTAGRRADRPGRGLAAAGHRPAVGGAHAVAGRDHRRHRSRDASPGVPRLLTLAAPTPA